MSLSSYQIPAPFSKVFCRLPAYPGSLMFVTGLNLALARHLPADTLRLLDGHKLRIRVVDAGIAFDFIWRDGSFFAQHKAQDKFESHGPGLRACRLQKRSIVGPSPLNTTPSIRQSGPEPDCQ